VIVGPPGSGKSTVGPLLANQFGVEFRDTDEDIVARAGKSISDIFTEDGEPAFREKEEQAIVVALAEHDGVLSLGGGAVLNAATRARLSGHTVIFLNVGMAEGVQRTGLSSARPLLTGVNPRATYKALLDARLPIYREVATAEVDTDKRSPEEVVAEITRLTDVSAVAHKIAKSRGER
jgi:shikimate kinase